MIGECVHNRNSELSDHQQGRFGGARQEWPLTLGGDYLILGMGMWETILSVLVRDDWGNPMWCPMGCFKIGVQTIPSDWEFRLEEGIDLSGQDLWTRWVARWGYSLLIDDPSHSDGLMDRQPSDLRAFHMEHRRREVENPDFLGVMEMPKARDLVDRPDKNKTKEDFAFLTKAYKEISQATSENRNAVIERLKAEGKARLAAAPENGEASEE